MKKLTSTAWLMTNGLFVFFPVGPLTTRKKTLPTTQTGIAHRTLAVAKSITSLSDCEMFSLVVAVDAFAPWLKNTQTN